MKNLVIATQNPSKLEYFKNLLSGFNLNLVSLMELGIYDEAEEDGRDERENALIKARYYVRKSQEVCLADDAGTYIPALDNMPGVQGRRWAGELPDDVSDEDWIDFFLNKIKHLSYEKRRGKYRIARAIITPNGEIFEQNWERRFKFTNEPNMKNYRPGWPMAAFIIEEGFDKPWTALTQVEKLIYESRNLEKFKKIFKKIYDN